MVDRLGGVDPATDPGTNQTSESQRLPFRTLRVAVEARPDAVRFHGRRIVCHSLVELLVRPESNPTVSEGAPAPAVTLTYPSPVARRSIARRRASRPGPSAE